MLDKLVKQFGVSKAQKTLETLTHSEQIRKDNQIQQDGIKPMIIPEIPNQQ